MLTNANNPDFKQLGQKMTNHSREALLQAATLAEKFGSAEIKNAHLLYAIYLRKGSVGSNLLADLGLKKEIFQQVLEKNSPLNNKVETPRRGVSTSGVSRQPLALSADLKRILTHSFATARAFGYAYVGTEHLVYALLETKDALIQKILAHPALRHKKHNLQKSLQAILEPDILGNLSRLFNLPVETPRRGVSTKSSATPFLDKFCLDLNLATPKNPELIVGRDQEIQRMIHILGRKQKNNPLLVGEPGVGKTALVTGLVQLLNAGEVPGSLYRKKILNLDVAQLIAGTSFRGEFESRLKEIIREAKEQKNVILFIDEIHTIVGAGNMPGSLDLANILKPALSRGEIQLIGATTPAEYKKYIAKDAALERRFQPVAVQEPSLAETKQILLGIKSQYENFHNVAIADAAIELAVDLSQRYIPDRRLPDKAIDVIDEAASSVRAQNKISDFIQAIRRIENEKITLLETKEKLVTAENFEAAIGLRAREKNLDEQIKRLHKQQAASEKEQRVQIQAADILTTIARLSGIPVEKLSPANQAKLHTIRPLLAAQVIGQPEVIEKLASTLTRTQAGIANPDRPLGSFLFLGPTGVGKTLTAKILAQEFFGAPENNKPALIRLDMSELMERHSVSSLIGSPAGYIGYGEGGNLTEKVRRQPYSVVLFDEIEKAHPEVFNLLLQILEDGLLTDAEGTPVSFKQTIIILTSNIGTDEFTRASQLGFATGAAQTASEKFNAIKEQTLQELAIKMRPELLNRLDHILVFNALDESALQKIAALEIEKLRTRLQKQGFALNVDKKIPGLIAAKSSAFKQGARLVRRNVQELLETPIAEMIIHGQVKNNKITVKVEKGEIKSS